nr:hypothetical protein [Proteus mirabilis]
MHIRVLLLMYCDLINGDILIKELFPLEDDIDIKSQSAEKQATRFKA